MAAARKSGRKADALPEGVLTIAQAEAAARAAQTPVQPVARSADAVPLAVIHLSPFVPFCDGLSVSDAGRWRDMAWRTPAQILRATLGRIQRRADQVALRWLEALPGVEIHDGANDPAPGCARLLAIIFDVPAAALFAAHAAMTAPAERIA